MKFKNVHFAPFVGENYDKGINGKKILILGESHYWGEEIYEGTYEDLKKGEYLDFTNDVINSYVAYQKGEREHSPWMNSFTKFANGFYNWSNDASVIDFWDSVLFYNFVQFPINENRTSPSEQEFKDSEPAFFEVLEAYQPDIIIVWGKRLWGQMPSNGEYGETSSLNNGKGLYYYNVGGRKIPAVVVNHPSSTYFSSSAYEDMNKALSEI